ncbi:hypothetical protein BYT27DRAFT_7264127 [Phlegmacium glaucopus]|nr:hypothetical protein BYT27DRAFT_7264127 [Phlegmacium glaucopus]
MLITIPSLVLVLSFLAQVTVLAVPVPLNDDVSMDARAPSAAQLLVTRSLWRRDDTPKPVGVMPAYTPPKLAQWSDKHIGTNAVKWTTDHHTNEWNKDHTPRTHVYDR